MVDTIERPRDRSVPKHCRKTSPRACGKNREGCRESECVGSLIQGLPSLHQSALYLKLRSLDEGTITALSMIKPQALRKMHDGIWELAEKAHSERTDSSRIVKP